MVRKTFSLGNNGFSVVGILISAGIVSGLALVLANITKQQQIVKKRTEAYFEVSNLSYLIQRTLENEEACTQTLGAGTIIKDEAEWSSIKNKDGEDVVVKGNDYGDRLLKVKTLVAKNVQISGQTGEIDLEITFKKLGSAAKNKNDLVSKKYPLSVEVDNNKRLVRCRSNYSNIVSTGKERMCRMLSGIYDPITENCDLSALLLEGQKVTCTSLEGTFANAPRNCDISPFIAKSVKAVCTSLQGTFDETASRCLLSSTPPSPKTPPEEEPLVLKDSYPICRTGYGADIQQLDQSSIGARSFETCFGEDPAKLFKSIRSENDIQARVNEWADAWLAFRPDGTLNSINYYRLRLTDQEYDKYRNKIYFVSSNPKKPLRPFYELIKTEIKLKYTKTGKWYKFTFSTGINFPSPKHPLRQKDESMHDFITRVFPDHKMTYKYKWLGPWKTLIWTVVEP